MRTHTHAGHTQLSNTQNTRACYVPALQSIYAESIGYTNKLDGAGSTSAQLRLARASQAELPVLTKTSRIVVLSPEDALITGEKGSRAPFWLAEVEEDEDVVLGEGCTAPYSLMSFLRSCSFRSTMI